MSTLDRAWTWTRPSMPATRTLALVGLATLLGSFLLVLRDVVDISGDLSGFYFLILGGFAAAIVLARLLRVVVALTLAGVALVGGLALYLTSLPYDPAVGAMVESNIKLLSGQSILEIERSTIWALSITPAPIFVTWYLGLRGWYGAATAVAGGMLGYLVLTGDAGLTVTLFGVLGAAAALGFGDLHRRDGSVRAADSVAVVLAVMVLVPALVTVVPGGAGGAVGIGGGGGGGADTVEANLLSVDSSFEVVGSISLSPVVRFDVESPESRYWRVASFNRYTGDGWVRSGGTIDYSEDELSAPPGESRRLTQQYTVRSSTNSMPAAWRPVAVGPNRANDTQITRDGGLEPEGPLLSGDVYQVTSAVPVVTPDDLSGSVGDDPSTLAERYTQLPASTPDRVARRTSNLVGDDATRYQAARRVQRWLRTNREYSLEVEEPEGNIADSFLFEMERGYCTYYATTMVTMLRTQDIPARLVTGYTPGEPNGEGEYTVRGLDSHAWVEVYFPETGWVQFDPTPAEPREAAEQARINEESGESTTATPTETSAGTTPTPSTPTPNGTTPTPSTATPPDGLAGATPTPGNGTDADSGGLPELPSEDQLVLYGIVLAGLVAGVRRSRVAEGAYRWAWLRYQPRADPRTDIERSWRRVAYLLERRYRPRRSDETVRSYLSAIDAGPTVQRLAALRERAVYDSEATPEMADEAVELVGRIRRE